MIVKERTRNLSTKCNEEVFGLLLSHLWSSFSGFVSLPSSFLLLLCQSLFMLLLLVFPRFTDLWMHEQIQKERSPGKVKARGEANGRKKLKRVKQAGKESTKQKALVVTAYLLLWVKTSCLLSFSSLSLCYLFHSLLLPNFIFFPCLCSS